MSVFEEKRKTNKILLIGWSVIETVLMLAYLLEVFKGERTIGYYAIFSAVVLIPSIMAWIFFWKK